MPVEEWPVLPTCGMFSDGKEHKNSAAGETMPVEEWPVLPTCGMFGSPEVVPNAATYKTSPEMVKLPQTVSPGEGVVAHDKAAAEAEKYLHHLLPDAEGSSTGPHRHLERIARVILGLRALRMRGAAPERSTTSCRCRQNRCPWALGGHFNFVFCIFLDAKLLPYTNVAICTPLGHCITK